MRRRAFIGGLGSAPIWPMMAGAQQRPSKAARIGIIDDAPIWDHFRRGLHDLGYVEGRDIAFEYRAAEGRPERLASAASELANLPVDIIAVSGSAATRAAREATTTIPILMIAVGDPLGAGFVQSLRGQAKTSPAVACLARDERQTGRASQGTRSKYFAGCISLEPE